MERPSTGELAARSFSSFPLSWSETKFILDTMFSAVLVSENIFFDSPVTTRQTLSLFGSEEVPAREPLVRLPTRLTLISVNSSPSPPTPCPQSSRQPQQRCSRPCSGNARPLRRPSTRQTSQGRGPTRPPRLQRRRPQQGPAPPPTVSQQNPPLHPPASRITKD